MGPRAGGPLWVELPRLGMRGAACRSQTGARSQAADTIDSAARGEPLAHCGGSTMAVPDGD